MKRRRVRADRRATDERTRTSVRSSRQREPSFSGSLLKAAVQALRKAGKDPSSLLERHGIDPFLDDEARVPHDSGAQLFVEAAMLACNSAFGIDVGASMQPPGHGELELLKLVLGSRADALEASQRFRSLLHDALHVHWEQHGSYAHVIPELRGCVMSKEVEDAIVAAIVQRVRAFVPVPWSPREVRFSYPAPRDVAAYERFLRCPVRFGEDACTLVVSARPFEQLEAPALSSGALSDLTRTATFDEDAASLHRRICNILLEDRHAGRWSADRVARALGTSRRTLDRRLREQGTSFYALVEELRYELAKNALRSHESCAAVSERLGFSDVRSFGRAFKRWSGVSPSEFQARKGSRV